MEDTCMGREACGDSSPVYTCPWMLRSVRGSQVPGEDPERSAPESDVDVRSTLDGHVVQTERLTERRWVFDVAARA